MQVFIFYTDSALSCIFPYRQEIIPIPVSPQEFLEFEADIARGHWTHENDPGRELDEGCSLTNLPTRHRTPRTKSCEGCVISSSVHLYH